MKKFRYTGKKIAALVLVGVMSFSITASATTESEIKKQQQATQKQLNEINSRMKSIESQRNSVLSQVNSLNSELTTLVLNMELLESDIEAKAEEVEQAQADYEAAKKKEEEQYEAMKLRIQYIYEEGDMDYLSLFLQAENFSDFLNRADFAQEIQTKDREMFLEYQETKQEVADLLEELEQEKADMEDLQAEYEDQKSATEAALSQKKAEQADYDSQLAAAKSQAATYKKQLQEQQSQLKKLEAERKKKEQEAAAAAAKNDKKTTTGTISSGSASSSSGNSSGSGSSATVSGGGSGASIASYALKFVGNPYVSGGTSLTNGADCSGFTWAVYQNFGISIPRQSDAQGHSGKSVSYADAQAGDIIYYGGHVGIYIGGGRIVHASTAKTGIKISSATYRSILSVRRYY
ncbi:C40 family peptidase [Candidatus Merdisoma sp. HCP28S3_D10]|uniref:C40 family peptidase n=1 Tax=unclassified Candidatus Merdisoma TaxID=3099611 RepID=UPI003F8CD5CD